MINFETIKKVSQYTLLLLFISCSTNKATSNYSIEKDPNFQYYGVYEFDVQIPSSLDPFRASLKIGISKRGNINSTIVWSFQNSNFYNSFVRNLTINDGVINFNSISSDGVDTEIEFYFTKGNVIKGFARTIIDPIGGIPPGTIFYLDGLKIQ